MKIYTTGQVAKICKVAPRTVAKWIDSGELGGFRIPGSQDRRVPRDDLERFMVEHRMPTDDLDDRPLLKLLIMGEPDFAEAIRGFIGRSLCQVERVATAFDMAFIAHSFSPDCVLIDLETDPQQGLAVCRGLRRQSQLADTIILAIVAPGQASQLSTTSVNEVFSRPFDVRLLAERIRSYLWPKLEMVMRTDRGELELSPAEGGAA